MENHEKQIGNNKYVFNAENYSDKHEYYKQGNVANKINLAINHYHLIEDMGDIDYASDDITGEDSLKKISEALRQGEMSPAQEMVYKNVVHKITNDSYKKTFGNKCPGYVNVSNYTRNGKEVNGYTRDCPYH